MENKNLIITAVVLFVLLVSMYGVRFILMGDMGENKVSAKEVIEKNILDREIDEIEESIKNYEEKEEEPIEIPIEEVIEEEKELVVPETPVQNNESKKTKKGSTTKKRTVTVPEQPVPIEEPSLEEIPEQPIPQPVEEPTPQPVQPEVPVVEDTNPTEDVVIEDN